MAGVYHFQRRLTIQLYNEAAARCCDLCALPYWPAQDNHINDGDFEWLPVTSEPTDVRFRLQQMESWRLYHEFQYSYSIKADLRCGQNGMLKHCR